MRNLDTVLTERDLDDEAAGEAVGGSRSQMSKLRRGKSRPSLDVAVRIEQIFGVPCAAWSDNSDLIIPTSQIEAADNTAKVAAFCGTGGAA